VTALTRLAIAAPVAAAMTWWTGPRDLPGMNWGTTIAVWAMLTAGVLGIAAVVTDGWGES
jgi:hypothetical protein